jgi:sigma-B regulation protein RsbU (phosphoserine phosphatase)
MAFRPQSRLPVADSRILVVDDIEWNRVLIGTLLEEGGFTRVSFAVDGADALQQIAEQVPDLVILDIMMPGVDGFEVCRRLRADPATRDLPVLVQTALSGVEDRNRAFEAGTTDLVTKPLDRAELLARVQIHLENRALIRNLQMYRDRLEAELDTARAIFEHLLPTPPLIAAVHAVTGLEIRSHMLQSSELGGDIWGLIELGGRRVGVYLLDMAGRGVSAALNVCRLHTLIRELTGVADQPGRFMTELSRSAEGLMIAGELASLTYGVLDLEADCFTVATAAASSPLVMESRGGPALTCPPGGLPLGVSRDHHYQQHTLPFKPGAILVLVSNAVLDVLDAAAPGGSSQQGLVELVGHALTEAPPSRGFQEVSRILGALVGDQPEDDHTLLWFRRPVR